jgi:hypothetical protein
MESSGLIYAYSQSDLEVGCLTATAPLLHDRSPVFLLDVLLYCQKRKLNAQLLGVRSVRFLHTTTIDDDDYSHLWAMSTWGQNHSTRTRPCTGTCR